MKRLPLLAAFILVIVSIAFPLNSSASDSRSVDDRVYLPGGLLLDPAVIGSWSLTEYRARRIDRVLVIIGHIREGRQSEALRMLDDDLRDEAKSFDADVEKLEKNGRLLYDSDRISRDRVQEVSRRLREYERKYPPVKQQVQPAEQLR